MLKTNGVIGLVLLARWSWPCFHSSKRLLWPSPARKKAGMGVQSDALEVEGAARFLNILLMNHFLFCFPLPHTNKYWTLSQCVCFLGKNMEITLLFGLPTIGLFFFIAPVNSIFMSKTGRTVFSLYFSRCLQFPWDVDWAFSPYIISHHESLNFS